MADKVSRLADGTMLPNVPYRLKMLLRDIVIAQDAGYPLFEVLTEARYELTFIDRLCVIVDIERARMVHEGLPVYPRPENRSFMLGLEERPYKHAHEPVPVPPKSEDEEGSADSS